MRKALLLLVVLAAFVAGCENKYKDPNPEAMGYDYYPIEVGDFRVYAVTDIRFRDNIGDTTRFQLRERVDTSFHDQTGQLVYKVIRSIRPNDRSTWLDDSVLTVVKNANMVVLTKDNTKYIKLVFPVKEGVEWIGDLYNSRVAADNRVKKRDEKEVYTYTEVGQPYTIGDYAFPKTAKVIQNDSGTLGIGIDERFEVYNEGIGLVHRLFNRVTFKSCDTENCGDVVIDNGQERHEILIDYGKL